MPRTPDVNLGGVLSNLDFDYEAAVECFTTGLGCPDLNPSTLALAHGNMGITYSIWCMTNGIGGVSYEYDTGRLDKAIAHLRFAPYPLPLTQVTPHALPQLTSTSTYPSPLYLP